MWRLLRMAHRFCDKTFASRWLNPTTQYSPSFPFSQVQIGPLVPQFGQVACCWLDKPCANSFQKPQNIWPQIPVFSCDTDCCVAVVDIHLQRSQVKRRGSQALDGLDWTHKLFRKAYPIRDDMALHFIHADKFEPRPPIDLDASWSKLTRIYCCLLPTLDLCQNVKTLRCHSTANSKLLDNNELLVWRIHSVRNHHHHHHHHHNQCSMTFWSSFEFLPFSLLSWSLSELPITLITLAQATKPDGIKCPACQVWL